MPDPNPKSNDALERRAYRLAGYAVMYFLIYKELAHERIVFLPVDNYLRTFVPISLEEDEWGWEFGTIEGNYRVITLVLLAGNVAEQIKFNMPNVELPNTQLYEKVAGMFKESFNQFDPKDWISLDEARRKLGELSIYPNELLQSYWTSVEVVAGTLLQQKVLSDKEIFAIIHRQILENAVPETKQLYVKKLERFAYDQAGHTTMYYLIRKGIAEKYTPNDRSLMLPNFDQISIEVMSADWTGATFSLGSLMTVPQVLIAGQIAVQIQYSLSPDDLRPSGHAETAEGQITAYIEEYSGDSMTSAAARAKRDANAKAILNEMSKYVEEMLRGYWKSVEALAQTLLQRNTISQVEAFEIIGNQSPSADWEQVRAKKREREARFTHWKPSERLKNLPPSDVTSPPKSRSSQQMARSLGCLSAILGWVVGGIRGK
ncbi:MAG: hypothetical protein ACYDBJ_17455 [Aggregatilineales bacterium]